MHSQQKNKPKNVMRKMCPNFDKEDALETVLEVPVPEEMFASLGNNVALRWQNMATWMKAQTSNKWSSPIIAGRYNEMSFLLYIVGSPLIPLQVQVDRSIHRAVKHSSIVSNSPPSSPLLLTVINLGRGPGPPSHSQSVHRCSMHRRKDHKRRGLLHTEARHKPINPGGSKRPKYEIIHHTVWGYFSQRSGLLVKFEDSRLLSVKTSKEDGDVFWKRAQNLYGEQSANHKRELEESWKIEEVDFNVWGLKSEFFMPPSEFKGK
ncbi:hypothetical protein BUALT_Bualt04G0076300 [Buddleja alternifolia]|uniref:Uncharacterized protein n=1 Tax=Buddleja alternifolia TaxID=168488 RepID=A0AAV6XM42_9LAMI|nr:hypothetical protein BUALT_Bualt04G0076300 [Buddleja alternifolia]